MAAEDPVRDLCDEATCSICLEYFRDPVTIAKCGHNFCQACLVQSWGKEAGGDLDVSCPQCRGTAQRRNCIPNRTLKNMVEIAKKLSIWGQQKVSQDVCEKHQEPLKLFCRDHDSLICVVCDRSKEHQCHSVVPREEAFQEYKDQICSNLKFLKAEREKILMYKADADKESQDLLNQTEEERQKTIAEFRQIHQFLEQREKTILAEIDGLEKEIERRREEHLVRELSSLENLIQDMEVKSQQSEGEFLQNIEKTLRRYEKKEVIENPKAFPPELTRRFRDFYDVKPLLEGVREQFPANVTLDPDTAHPRLILSEDRKSMRVGEEWQDLPVNPGRFDYWFCVLGREGFTARRHFWEIAVGSEEEWAVGVARKSVQRKGRFELSPEEGIWAVGKWKGKYRVLNCPDFTTLSLIRELKRIQVTLNCAEGQVTFCDADRERHLYTYSGASFYGETLFPFFYVVGKAHLRLSL